MVMKYYVEVNVNLKKLNLEFNEFFTYGIDLLAKGISKNNTL